MAQRRAIYKANISAGPVNVPVKLYSTVRPQKVSFNLLHDADHVRLRQKMVCPVDEQVVEPEHQQKGYPLATGRYIVFDDRQLSSIEPQSSRQIELLSFIDPDSIDSRYLARAYYLGPDGHNDAYKAMHQAMTRKKRLGLCRWVMRKKYYLGLLNAMDNCLAIIALRPGDEIVDTDTLELPQAELSGRELKIAADLVGALAGKFDPSGYVDEFQQKLAQLVRQKALGREIPVKKPRQPQATESDKLLEALQQSLEKTRSRK